MSRHVPRRLLAVHDWPRATAGRGEPLLEAAKHVPLPHLFPRNRCVSDGRAYEDLAWSSRTAARRAACESEARRIWAPVRERVQ